MRFSCYRTIDDVASSDKSDSSLLSTTSQFDRLPIKGTGNALFNEDQNMQNKGRARRRINLSEYMNKKNRQPFVATSSTTLNEFSVINTSVNTMSASQLNSIRAPLDTRALASSESKKPDGQFYTDILDCLRSEEPVNDSSTTSTEAVTIATMSSNDVIITSPLLTTKSDNDDIVMTLPEISYIGNPILTSVTTENNFSPSTPLFNIPAQSNASNGILCVSGFHRNNKKSVSWADQSGNQLESIKLIGGNAHTNEGIHAGISIGKFEMQIERNMRMGSTSNNQQQLMAQPFFSNCLSAQGSYGPLYRVEIPNHIQKPIIQSKERGIQAERHKTILQDIFLPCVSIPDTPAEPDYLAMGDQDERNNDNSHGCEPRIIPLDEISIEDEEMPMLPTTSVSSDNGHTISVPPSLPPELAELLVRAHQNSTITNPAQTQASLSTSVTLPSSTASTTSVNVSAATLPANAISLLEQLRSMLHTIAGPECASSNDKDTRLYNDIQPTTQQFPVAMTSQISVSNYLTTISNSVAPVELSQVHSISEAQIPDTLSQNQVQQNPTVLPSHVTDTQYTQSLISNQSNDQNEFGNLQNSQHQINMSVSNPHYSSSNSDILLTPTSATISTGPLLCPRPYWNSNRGPYPLRMRQPPYAIRGMGRHPRHSSQMHIMNPWANFHHQMSSNQFAVGTDMVRCGGGVASSRQDRQFHLNQRMHPQQQRFQQPHRFNVDYRNRFGQPAVRYSRALHSQVVNDRHEINSSNKHTNNNAKVSSSSDGTGEWL
ncbi:hypothetical protein GJ496_006536 [Pomphorhynchus laevis]|nr:hypothetical protein GJ496_006536 [Pomphorhynchus laevis]